MRLGDLDALKEIIETYRPIAITSDYLQGKNNMVDYCIAEIDNAPTVEPEITEKQAIAKLINSGWLVKHDKELRDIWKRPEGKWVANCGEHYCSNCENVALSSDFGEILTDFCPYCGASML